MLKALFAMMSLRLWGAAATLFLLAIGAALAHADDGIPDNCERTYAAFYRPEVFPRYEPQNQRLVLVNWSTGEEVMILAQGLAAAEFRITGWSPECQYLTGAAGTPDENGTMIWNTLVWDTVNNALIGVFEGARIIPHPVIWDTNSIYLIVETRDGAYLWHIPTGNRIQLTSSSDGNGRSFKPGTLEWDYANGQLHVWLTISPYGGAIYDLNTGDLLGVSDRFGRAISTEATAAQIVQVAEQPWCHQPTDIGIEQQGYSGYRYILSLGYGPDGIRPVYETYNHRIVLMKSNTHEILQVIETDITASQFLVMGWSPDCRYLAAAMGHRKVGLDTVIWDLSTDPATRVGIFEDAIHRPHSLEWDPSSTYVIVGSRNGVYLWHLPTDTRVRLTTDVIADCERWVVGCNGQLIAYGNISWDSANAQVRVTLTSGITVTYDLNTGYPVAFADNMGQPLDDDRAQTLKERIESPYGCRPDVQYQVYNKRLVLKDWITGELIVVVEDKLELSEFRFIGWSPNCRYIAAEITIDDQSETALWDLTTNTRTAVMDESLLHDYAR